MAMETVSLDMNRLGSLESEVDDDHIQLLPTLGNMDTVDIDTEGEFETDDDYEGDSDSMTSGCDELEEGDELVQLHDGDMGNNPFVRSRGWGNIVEKLPASMRGFRVPEVPGRVSDQFKRLSGGLPLPEKIKQMNQRTRMIVGACTVACMIMVSVLIGVSVGGSADVSSTTQIPQVFDADKIKEEVTATTLEPEECSIDTCLDGWCNADGACQCWDDLTADGRKCNPFADTLTDFLAEADKELKAVTNLVIQLETDEATEMSKLVRRTIGSHDGIALLVGGVRRQWSARSSFSGMFAQPFMELSAVCLADLKDVKTGLKEAIAAKDEADYDKNVELVHGRHCARSLGDTAVNFARAAELMLLMDHHMAQSAEQVLTHAIEEMNTQLKKLDTNLGTAKAALSTVKRSLLDLPEVSLVETHVSRGKGDDALSSLTKLEKDIEVVSVLSLHTTGDINGYLFTPLAMMQYLLDQIQDVMVKLEGQKVNEETTRVVLALLEIGASYQTRAQEAHNQLEIAGLREARFTSTTLAEELETLISNTEAAANDETRSAALKPEILLAVHEKSLRVSDIVDEISRDILLTTTSLEQVDAVVVNLSATARVITDLVAL